VNITSYLIYTSVKLGVDAERYGGMDDHPDNLFTFDNDLYLKCEALCKHYKDMAAARVGMTMFYPKINKGPVMEVAKILEDIKLARLFVEAQFHNLSKDFCWRRFKRAYPPINVVFGGKCWNRYREYVNRGIRDAT
jgi:hypothetical protein